MEPILKRVYRKIKHDGGRDDLIRAMDKIDHLEWELPTGVKKQKWARLDIDTSGRDALKAATNVFSAFLPKWDVAPRGPKSHVAAEQFERWIEWFYMRMNDRSKSTVTWSVMKSAAKFDMMVARVDYLPYYIVGDKPTKRQKMALRKGPFATTVYHPLYIHYEESEWGLEWVADYSVHEAEEVLAHWAVYANPDDKEKGGDQVARAARWVNDYIKGASSDKRALLAVVDYTDLDRRYVKAIKTNKEVADPELLLADDQENSIIILDTKNELPFNPWVIAVGGTSFEKGSENEIDPLLAPLHKANLWSNQNLHESLQTSKVLRRFGFPDMIIYTATGEKKRIDFSGNANTLNMKLGQEQAEPVTAPQVDPGLASIVERGRSRMSSTTGVQILQNVNQISGNLQFATVQALLQMALGQVTPYKNVAEKGLSQIGERLLEWVAFTGDTLNAFYIADKGTSDNRKRGAQVSISPDEIDLENMAIKCELSPNTPTDKNQRVSMAVLANEKLGVPKSELVEDLDYGAPEVLRNEYLKEQITNGALQSFIETMRAMALQALQQAQGATGAPGANGAVPTGTAVKNPSQAVIQGQGYDQAAGGASPVTADQGLTREGVTNQSVTGQGRPAIP
jgi:hypothetical protein